MNGQYESIFKRLQKAAAEHQERQSKMQIDGERILRVKNKLYQIANIQALTGLQDKKAIFEIIENLDLSQYELLKLLFAVGKNSTDETLDAYHKILGLKSED